MSETTQQTVGPNPSILVFDVNETLIDLESIGLFSTGFLGGRRLSANGSTNQTTARRWHRSFTVTSHITAHQNLSRIRRAAHVCPIYSIG